MAASSMHTSAVRDVPALRAAAGRLDDETVTVIARRSEGWPAGLYLADLVLAVQPGRVLLTAGFAGSDRIVTGVLTLAELDAQKVKLLT